VQIKTIRVNGIEYAVTWTSISAWTLRLPVGTGTNILNVAGYDVHGNALTNFTRAITVNYTGPAPVAPGTVVINEIQYNPAAPDTGFVELFNTSSDLSFDLSGWRVNGLDYTFPSGTVLTNRGYIVLANEPTAYGIYYPSNPPAFARFSGDLQNAGETLTLFQPGPQPGEEIIVDRVRYENAAPWNTAANGLGFSLQLVDPSKDNARVSNWSTNLTDPGVVIPWQTHVTNINIGSSLSGSTNLYIFFNGAGSIDIDELSLIAQSGPTAGIDIISNGGFEFPLAEGWTVGSVMSGTTITPSAAYSGAGGLHLVATGAGGITTNTSFSQSPPILASTIYTMSFRYKATFTNAVTLNLRFNSQARPAITVPAAPTPPLPTPSTPGQVNNNFVSLPTYDPLWLNELQASNTAGALDNMGEREPWIELYNAGTNNLDLSAYYLANNYNTNLTQWQFPPGTILAPGEFRVVWADGETGETDGTNAHTSFRLNAGSGSVALVRLVGGQPQITDYLNYTNLPAGWAYGDFPNGQPFFRQNFYLPTPGGTNDNLSAPLVVYINEWMAANTGTLLNESNNNKYDDWFELYNPGEAPADLGGYYLTDNLGSPFNFHIPAGYIIPPHGFLHVWADAAAHLNTNTDPALHVSFKLDQAGDSIGLFGSDGRLVNAITFGGQANDVAEGRYPDGPDAQWISPLSIATPGAPNALYGNRYPFLAALPVQTAFVGQPSTFVAPGSDPDAPPQILAYTLLLGPTNATLNPSSGALIWTPTAAQENTTNTVTIRVNDNGAPVLRAEHNYTIVVRTAILLGGITTDGNGMISFTVSTTPGKTYRVEYKDDLNAALWTPLPPDHVAAGASITINDTIGANPQRFYQVRQLD
jgi:hypothetical protein